MLLCLWLIGDSARGSAGRVRVTVGQSCGVLPLCINGMAVVDRILVLEILSDLLNKNMPRSTLRKRGIFS